MADPEETTEKKARHRSPAYPTIGLREAVERVGKLYKADGKAGAPSKLAAVHIGFATPHGQALSALAALKKFGLVAESGNRIVPTQRAIEILNLPANDARLAQALKDAAQAPEIYRELMEQHRDTGWPSDEVLQADLITYKSFNPHSVAGFVRDFRDTLEFAGLSNLSGLGSGQEDESAVQTEAATTQQTSQPSLKPSFPTIPARTYAFDISIPRDVKGELRIVGQLGKDDLDRLRKALNGQLAMIEAALED